MPVAVILGQGKAEQHQQDILAGGDDLAVGEAGLGVEDKGADAAQSAHVGDHRAHHISAAVEEVFVAAGKGQGAQRPGHEDEEHSVGDQPGQVPGEREHPETQQGQHRVHAYDVKADEAVGRLIGHEPLPVQDVARDDGHDQVGDYVYEA